jgi:hypothetical protein
VSTYSVSAAAPAIEHSVPRFAGAERKIQHWTQTERGRHSAAIEVPDLLVATAASSSAPCAKPRRGGADLVAGAQPGSSLD